MESDHFYDSLDDGESGKPSESSDETDDMIPFYGKNISRSEIDLSGNSFASVRESKPTSRRKSIRRGGYKLKSISYLDMFRKKRAGYCRDISSESPENLDSSESTSYTNSRSTYNELEGESFYLKTEDSDSCCDNHSTLRENPDLALLITNTVSKKNPTEQERKHYLPSHKKPTTVKRTYSKMNTNKFPEMGSLGPEIPTHKLEIFRKRQQYGKRVSLTNGIRIKEKKVLQNLKDEITNSKNVFI